MERGVHVRIIKPVSVLRLRSAVKKLNFREVFAVQCDGVITHCVVSVTGDVLLNVSLVDLDPQISHHLVGNVSKAHLHVFIEARDLPSIPSVSRSQLYRG